MASAVEKELGISHPSQQHGVLASEHLDEQFDPHFEPTSDRSDADTLGPTTQYGERTEKRLEAIRTTSHRLERTESGVDIEKAQKDFADLSRELSAHSRRMSRQTSRVSARNKEKTKASDVEKAASASESSSDEHWDLEETLRGNRTADQEAGIKSKRIGTLSSRNSSLVF